MDRFLDDNNIVRKNKINDVLQRANALKERTQKKIESLTPEQYELLTASPTISIKQTKKQILQQVEDLTNNNELITSTEEHNNIKEYNDNIEQQTNISVIKHSDNDLLPPIDSLPSIDPLPIAGEQNLPQQEVIAKSNIVDKIPINEINVSEQDQLKADALLASINSTLLANPIKTDIVDINNTDTIDTINKDIINTDTIDTEAPLIKDNSIDNFKQEEQDIKNNDVNTLLQKDDSFINKTNIVNESNQSSSETISSASTISSTPTISSAQKKMHPTPTSTAHRLSANQSQSLNRQIANEARQVKPMERNVIPSRSNLAQNKDNVNNIVSKERLNQPKAILLEKQRISYNELVDLQVEFEIISRMLSRVEERLKPSYSTKIQAIQTQIKEKELRLATIANLLAGR